MSNYALKQELKTNFKHLFTARNPEYHKGIVEVPFDACLINNNSEKFKEIRIVQKNPKWLTTMTYDVVDLETGEVKNDKKLYLETDSIKSSNNRKIKSLDKFCNYFDPLYKKKEVSLMFHTFTKANEANITFPRMIENLKYHYSSILNKETRGYIWTLEVSKNLHIHYHLCMAIDRLSVRKIPDCLYFEELWGKRTQVEFVRKNVRHYMAKYFAKENYRVENMRSYGCSKNFN